MRRTIQRAAALGVLAVGLASVHLPGRPTTLCLLRAVTGFPCPLCGGTTAAVRMGQGELLAALRASPLTVLSAAAFVLRPLAPVRRLWQPSRRVTWGLILAGAAASELWQLHRFGLL